MAYLSKDEYKQFTGKDPDDNFNAMLDRASAELDVLTRFFYQYHELGDSIRDKQFKRAVAYQIELYDIIGATSVEELNNQPDSIRIGDTTVSQNSTIASTEATKRDNLISKDAINMLAFTGLLYRGSRGGHHGIT